MNKLIKVTRSQGIFVVKIERETIGDKNGLSIMIFPDNENSQCVMKHFLDFSKYPSTEVESNMAKFIDHFNENIAVEWVDGYLNKK